MRGNPRDPEVEWAAVMSTTRRASLAAGMEEGEGEWEGGEERAFVVCAIVIDLCVFISLTGEAGRPAEDKPLDAARQQRLPGPCSPDQDGRRGLVAHRLLEIRGGVPRPEVAHVGRGGGPGHRVGRMPADLSEVRLRQTTKPGCLCPPVSSSSSFVRVRSR